MDFDEYISKRIEKDKILEEENFKSYFDEKEFFKEGVVGDVTKKVKTMLSKFVTKITGRLTDNQKKELASWVKEYEELNKEYLKKFSKKEALESYSNIALNFLKTEENPLQYFDVISKNLKDEFGDDTDLIKVKKEMEDLKKKKDELYKKMYDFSGMTPSELKVLLK